jgi:hypothetical protein
MKTFDQRELRLWQTLREAPVIPDKHDSGKIWIGRLWDVLENAIAGREVKAQIEIGLEAVGQMAELVCKRSSFYGEEWEVRYSNEGPAMPEEALNRYVRQTTTVDLDRYIVPFDRKKHDYPDSREPFTVVAQVDGDLLAQSFESISLVGDCLEGLEYDENIKAWADTIQCYLEQAQIPSAPIVQIQQETGLPLVKLWLAGLLEGFKVRRTGDFYDVHAIWIGPKLEDLIQSDGAAAGGVEPADMRSSQLELRRSPYVSSIN